MKIMTLNIWGGNAKDKLLQFIETYKDIDIFCLQEVYHNASNRVSTDDNPVSLNIYSEIHAVLTDHIGYFKPAVKDIYGLCIFAKNTIEVIDEGKISIYDNENYSGMGPSHSRILQWVKCQYNNINYFVMNMHGLWNGMGKTDTKDRITQSQRIYDFMSPINTPKILCGDFNLRPDTKSLQILENNMTNLIKKYNVNSTRSSLYPKEEKYADYVLTCPNVKIKSFRVLNDEVSDHLPLLIECF